MITFRKYVFSIISLCHLQQQMPQARVTKTLTKISLIQRNFKLFLWRNSPYWARASPIYDFYDSTRTHGTRYDSSERVLSLVQRPLLDTHNRKSAMLPERFEPAILASARPLAPAHSKSPLRYLSASCM